MANATIFPAKYDFKNEKVNAFYQSLENSLFISPEFITNLGATFFNAMSLRFHANIADNDEDLKFQNTKIKETFKNFYDDMHRISIFTEKFQNEITDNLALLLWPEDAKLYHNTPETY
jgi:hypothetical protein